MRRLLGVGWLTALLCCGELCGGDSALLDGNMVGNPGFEYDWHNNRAEGHVLAFRGDWSFNASDGKPDYWDPKGPHEYANGVAHTGERSLLLNGGASVTRRFPLGVVSGGRSGGDWRWAGPPQSPMSYEQPAKAARTVTARVWYRSDNLSAANTLTVALIAFGVTKSASAAQPAEDWRKLDVVVTRQEIEAAYAEGKAKGLPKDQKLMIAVKGKAQVYLDDVSLAEDFSADWSLTVNGGFESTAQETGRPTGWSAPKKYMWRPPQYYQWTDWHHAMSPIRGSVTACNLVARSGSGSLLMQVYPGDEMMVEGEPVALKQTDRGIIEIGAFVLADRVKWFDIRAVDELGVNVPALAAFSGGWRCPPDGHQIFPSNAHRWVYLRKWFQGSRPLKSVRPQLCARGFNGDTRDDGGTRPNVCQTGLAWWDDVRVTERTSSPAELKKRGIHLIESVTAGPDTVMISSFDPGERLFGENLAAAVVNNPSREAVTATLMLAATRSGGRQDGLLWEFDTTEATLQAGESKRVAVPYRLDDLDGHWARQGNMFVVIAAGKPEREFFDRLSLERTLSLAYNTWPVVVDFDFSKHYATPAENPQSVAINLGVAQGTLKKTKQLSLEIRRRRDGEVVQTAELGDPATAMANTARNLASFPEQEFGVPGPVHNADRKNLIALKLDLSKLPVHPVDHPVRDHYLRLRGLDGSGKELFRGDSQFFGRVQQINEKLPKIASTAVRKDGTVLINGEPVFLMAGNGYTTARYGLSGDLIKRYGFNCCRWVEGADAAGKFWAESNLYSLETMVKGIAMNGTAPEVRTRYEPKLKEWLAAGKLDGAVTLALYYEHSSSHDSPQSIENQKMFTQVSHEVAKRITNFGGGGAHNVYTVEKSFDAYDSFGLEIEPFGPPRGGLEIAAGLRKGGKAWFHLPQTYDPTPFEQFRFDQYATILQGGRGFSTIHGLGDPSFMRGITGEIRYLSPAIFSSDHGDPRTAVTPDIWWIQKKASNQTTIIALSKPPCEIGKWTWRESDAASGKRAHTGVSEFAARPMPDGLRLHGLREIKPILIQKGDLFTQRVWLDPNSAPSTIAWGVRGDAKWDFNGCWGQPFDFQKWRDESVNWWLGGELLPGTWQIAWQINQKSSDWFSDHILHEKTFKAKGQLPASGQWTRLEMSADALGLVGKQLDGFFYLAKDGEAWWDRSAIVRGGKELVVCDDYVGLPREELASVKFSVPWAKDGAKVKVLFEERELEVKGGAFADDFRGSDTYLGVRGGATADALGWHLPGTKLMAQTLGYVTPNAPVEVHIYEIVEQ